MEFRNATIVFRTAFSILLSASPVSRFVLRVDLNSTLSHSPSSMMRSTSDLSISPMPMTSEFSSRKVLRMSPNTVAFLLL